MSSWPAATEVVAVSDDGCDHEWIPFGLARHNYDRPGITGEGPVAQFFRVRDVKCLDCGAVEPIYGGHTIGGDDDGE